MSKKTESAVKGVKKKNKCGLNFLSDLTGSIDKTIKLNEQKKSCRFILIA